jgi:cytochrome c oxidase subunit 4
MPTSSATSSDPVRSQHAPAGHGSLARYVVVWLALMVLTALTIRLGRTNVIVALAIAVCKATLVALFFMHLWESTGENRLVLVVAVVFVSLLSLGVVTDFATRLPSALPPNGAGPPQVGSSTGATQGG